jgi:hypothetical protein
MKLEVNELRIPVSTRYGDTWLTIVATSAKDKLYLFNDADGGESCYQLEEGSSYQYEFERINSHSFQFVEEGDIVRHSSFSSHLNMGTILTGIYVGQLTLHVKEISVGEEVATVKIEIRSVKSEYESDYRTMLDDIALYYTDLVLMQGSPIRQQLRVDEYATSQTLYQKFSFVRSVIDSKQFQEAINKIMSNPVRKWTETTQQKNIERVRHLTRKNIRQIATSTERIVLPEKFGNYGLSSVPKRLEVDCKIDTIDNQENQFVKFVLETFCSFCSDLSVMKNASDRLKEEAYATINKIEGYLDTQFFHHISAPTHLNMNSPVLQRKEGYREVMQAWLLFDLAAKLNWDGGDNIYEAGKKNVATLYEYWLFFKLQDLISEFFDIRKTDKQKLVTCDSDKINLNIKQGKMNILRGKTNSSMRVLNVAFYYNRTFSKVTDENPISKAGSWTMAMRPDYTLSIWCGDISEEEAEAQDLITHLHFDAKYRLNRVILEDDNDIANELDAEKCQQELGIYKRADLLKMHAYKDAIRRTSGAYVLYPGTENKALHGYHEIVPGLGAFSIRPGHWEQDSLPLKQFLSEVKAHMFDRASEREQMAYYSYDTYKECKTTMVTDALPESVGENRDFIPNQTSVIVAYYKNEMHLNWILTHHMYNLRAGDSAGSMNLDEALINARYILLHDGKTVQRLIRLKKGGPKVFTRNQLLSMGYPHYLTSNGEIDAEREKREAKSIYLVFYLYTKNGANWVEEEMRNYKWTIPGLSLGRSVTLPRPQKLVDLLNRKTIVR